MRARTALKEHEVGARFAVASRGLLKAKKVAKMLAFTQQFGENRGVSRDAGSLTTITAPLTEPHALERRAATAVLQFISTLPGVKGGAWPEAE